MTGTMALAAVVAVAASVATGAAHTPPVQTRPAQTTVRRLVLVAAANRGGEDRPRLKYALSDAGRFSQVMQALGGVDAADVVLLDQPRAGDLDGALIGLRQRVLAARRATQTGEAVRTEVFFYYSGHADEKGLLLGDDRLSYVTLRERLDEVPADVRIGVLDACASGAVTRPKGGKAGKVRSPFTIDQSSDMRGEAFLTSSSADESAQESDRLGGSFFTHYLISGLRGAADVSGDRRVTLNEAYQFAFNETLSRTVGTRGGPQHPVYDITMTGTGDVVFTDLRQTTAGFIVAAPIDGRFYVLDDRKRLVLEFYKPAGRPVDIGLEAGVYEVRFEREPRALGGRLEIRDGEHQVLDLARFGPASLEFTRLRGVDTGPEYVLNGRHHVGVGFGMWSPSGAGELSATPPPQLAGAYVSAGSLSAKVEYLKFVRDDLALGGGAHILVDSAESAASIDETSLRDRTGVCVPVIVRWNPLRRVTSWRTAEPYVIGTVGPLLAAYNSVRVAAIDSPFKAVASETVVEATVGGSAGGGVDLRLGRSWTAGVTAAYRFSGDVQARGAGTNRYAGWELTFGFGRLFGAPKPSRR